MASGNPYTKSDTIGEVETRPEYVTRERAYTEDSQQGPYAGPYGGTPYADRLKYGPDSTPDPTRLEMVEPKAYRQDSRSASLFWRLLGQDRSQRESVQHFVGTQQSEKGVYPGQKRFADRPGLRPSEELRVTAAMSPATGGLVVRPFTGKTPKRFNGMHSSLADHRRMDATIFGMRPAYRARSTFRLDPIPWGERVVDKQALNDDYMGDGPYTQQDNLPYNSRSHRLG